MKDGGVNGAFEHAVRLPMHGAHNPSSTSDGTTPGSFARKPDIGGPLAFASPDTPGKPRSATPCRLPSVIISPNV